MLTYDEVLIKIVAELGYSDKFEGPSNNAWYSTCDLIKKGHSPNQIKEEIPRNYSTLKGHLDLGIARGMIKKSEIIYLISRNEREFFDSLIKKYHKDNAYWIQQEYSKEILKAKMKIDLAKDTNHKYCNINGVEYFLYDNLNLLVYCEFRNSCLPDAYDYCRQIETTIHAMIESYLRDEYTESWWSHIPEYIRKEFSTNLKKESHNKLNFSEDDENLYNYLSFGKLLSLVAKFSEINAFIGKERLNKLWEINKVRNKVAHPVNLINPITDEDYHLLRNFVLDHLTVATVK